MVSVINCKTKKALKERVGDTATRVLLETSMFGPEIKDDCRLCVVGPSPYKRKWYANVTITDGKIARVS